MDLVSTSALKANVMLALAHKIMESAAVWSPEDPDLAPAPDPSPDEPTGTSRG